MSKSRPSHVKIGAYNYPILYEDVIFDAEHGQAYEGRISHTDEWIKLSIASGGSPTGPTRLAETLLHEIVHGLDENRQIGLDERQVDQIAAGLFAVMVDNPHLFGSFFAEVYKP